MKTREEVRDLGIQWDARRNCYVRRDGSVLPVEERNYRRIVLSPRLSPDYELELLVERENPKRVEVTVSRGVRKGTAPALEFRVVRVGDCHRGHGAPGRREGVGDADARVP